ncbi:MAG: 5'/3'-nucleotidase SurE [Bacillota bacterium]|nr:5'/3'-nucleotidase SurE [Bacillota bacterium]
MRILITNDDGLQAEGISILASALSEIGEVYVVAPATQQSAASHSLTVRDPLRAQRCPLPGITENAWAVTGTPADCIKLALEQLLDFKPDLVVSGINHGPNLATDTLYSGTVAGAMEGFLSGISAIAVSVVGSHRRIPAPGNFALAGKIAAFYGGQLHASGEKMFLNINVPGATDADVKGVRFCPTGWRWYKDAFARRVDPFGQEYYWMQGVIEDGVADGNTDVELCAEGYITISPLQYDLTNYNDLEKIASQDLFAEVDLLIKE